MWQDLLTELRLVTVFWDFRGKIIGSHVFYGVRSGGGGLKVMNEKPYVSVITFVN